MKVRIKVGVPARDTVMTGFFHSAAMAIATAAAHPDIEISLSTSAGTLICDQRNGLAKTCVDGGYDWLLFLDSDMRFPADTILRLLSHQAPFVAANYTTRRAPAEPVAFKRIGTLEKLWTDEDSTGLEECAACGLGVALIHREVFEKMEKPWFLIPYLAEQDGNWGEDVWFCNQARKAGFPIQIDHDLSKEVTHIGLREYDYQDAAIMKDEVMAAWKAGRAAGCSTPTLT